MTEISPSAREAAERYAKEAIEKNISEAYQCCPSCEKSAQTAEVKTAVGRWALQGFIAGYQARDSEGKGEAWAWPVKPNGWLIIEDHSEDGSWSGHAYSYNPRGSSINAEGARPVWLTPPAPKDQRVERLVEAARGILATTPWESEHQATAIEKLSEALRAFGDGKAEGGR